LTEPQPPLLPAGRSAVGIALICIGLLILVPSGLCSAWFGLQSLTDSHGLALVVLVYGGPPMAIGAALLFVGLRLRRK
jgi:hypothetical protein